MASKFESLSTPVKATIAAAAAAALGGLGYYLYKSSKKSTTETDTPTFPVDEKALQFPDLKLDEKEYIELLGQMIAQTPHLQNAVQNGLTPEEDRICDICIEFLKPYTAPNGPLKVRKVTYREKRSNLIIEYAADPALANGKDKTVSFVGCHMDVVMAGAPETWKKCPPFKLTVDGDSLYGRGVTDCLGHVALLTCVFKALAIAKPKLAVSVIGIFIANEEASAELGIGVDELVKRGELARCKNGPLFWVDSADFGPTLGTGGVTVWELQVNGKLFHSGFPHKGINAIELATEAVKYIQDRFYKDFPKSKAEETYKFEIGSSFKPTQIKVPPGSANQIPGECTISGDIRATPFHNMNDIKVKIQQYVNELNVSKLPSPAYSKYELKGADGADDVKGKITLNWLGTAHQGVAVNLGSLGYKALYESVHKIRGTAKPFSLTGSLPCIRELQDEGFDVQVVGFGRMATYHCPDEMSSLKEMGQGFKILTRLVDVLNNKL